MIIIIITPTIATITVTMAMDRPLTYNKNIQELRGDLIPKETIERYSFLDEFRTRSEQNGESGAKQRMKGGKLGKIR